MGELVDSDIADEVEVRAHPVTFPALILYIYWLLYNDLRKGNELLVIPTGLASYQLLMLCTSLVVSS